MIFHDLKPGLVNLFVRCTFALLKAILTLKVRLYRDGASRFILVAGLWWACDLDAAY